MINNPLSCNNNKKCEANEDCVSCPGDCGTGTLTQCGNGLCEVSVWQMCILW